MNRNDAFPSAYLRKDDLKDGDIRLQIADCFRDEVPNPAKLGETIEKTLLSFHNSTKLLVLNGEQWDQIEQLYGESTDGWVDNWIILFVDPNVKFGTKKVGGIRVREIAANVPAPAPPAPPPAVPPPVAVAAVATVPADTQDAKDEDLPI